MIKLPLFLNGALVDGGRPMTKAEASKLVKATHGEQAKAIKTDGDGGSQWRAIY